MTSHRSDIPSVSDICAHVEHLGYATSRHISAITEQEKASMDKSKDQDRGKGANGGRTSRIRVAILACKVNLVTVMRT